MWMELEWVTLQEFPEYVISNYGDVVNKNSGRWMAQSETREGHIKVGLVRAGKQFTRSVAVLVAEAFVVGHGGVFDTAVHLDGDRKNNRADNLSWRPRWFAWRYSAQFGRVSDNAHIGPIRDTVTGQRYIDVYEAAIVNCLLMEDIRKSIVMEVTVFPTHQRFEMV